VLERIIELVSNLGTLGLAAAASLLAFAETGIGLDLIVPGEAGMIVAGAAAEQGGHPLWVVILGAAIGATLGDCVSYAIGRRWGLRILERFEITKRRLVPAVHRAEPFFERWGGLAVFFGRWVGALRAVVPVVAGTAKMPFPRFLAWNVAASIAWSTTVVGAGYAFGLPAARAVDSAGIWVYAGVAVAVFGIWMFRRSRAAATA
jgi:membrane-associated protein